jgi:hypothetical protein
MVSSGRLRLFVRSTKEELMRPLRIGFLLVLFVAVHTHAVTVRAQATTTVERVTVPFVVDDVNPCNGEAVLLTGELKLTTRITVDGQGKTHVAFSLVPSQVRGEGESGTAYSAVGGEREHLNFTESAFPFIDSFTSIFNLVSAGGTDNFTAKIVFHVTVTADGTVRSEVAHFSGECHG